MMNGLKKATIEVDRKVLADLAVFDKAAFAKIADQAKAGLGALTKYDRETEEAAPPFFDSGWGTVSAWRLRRAGKAETDMHATTMNDVHELVSAASAEFAAIADAAQLEQAKARYLGKSGSLTELLKGLGKLPAQERKEAGAAINAAKGRDRAGPGRSAATRSSAPSSKRSCRPKPWTSHCPAAAAAAGGCIRSRVRWTASSACSARSASRLPTVRRSRPISTTSPRSTRRRIIPRARCTTPSTSRRRRAFCCARIPRRSRCRYMAQYGHQAAAEDHRAGPCRIASTPMPRIRRCSIRSRACGSDENVSFADLKGVRHRLPAPLLREG